MSTLKITFKNNSTTSNTDVHIGFVPGSSSAAVTMTNAKAGSAVTSLYDGYSSSNAAGNWYGLDSLSDGVNVTSFSGRIYVCYGTPWSLLRDGYEPAQSVADPNLFLRYDKMELTFTGDPNDVADLTSIDYWSIPMSLVTSKGGTVVETVSGLLGSTTAQNIYDSLTGLTTTTVSGLKGPGGVDGKPLPALVPGKYKQCAGGPKPGTAFARIIGPSSYPPAFPAPGAIPVIPYDIWENYLKHLHKTFGPGTAANAVVPTLGNGVIATIAGKFHGVGKHPPSTGPQSRQSYDLTATINKELDITLTSDGGKTTMLYKKDDLLNPSGIYGGNTPYYLNGANTPTMPGNDVYGWIGGDLFSGFNIGALGSSTSHKGTMVGAMNSQSWFKLHTSSFYAGLQPGNSYYNQYAATLAPLSDAYNFAFSDRFSHVLASLNPANIDTLQVVLEDDTIAM